MSPQEADRVLGGRYRLLHEIARGGMAVVWQAEDTLLDRHVALKVLHPQFAADPEFLERFRREARAAARLSHPNIVSIYDVGENEATHTPFIVMELVEGGNLKDLIRRSAPLPEDRIRSIGAALAAALDYANGRGLIHRDVKPHNVLLGDDGRPRLTDFGIAQAVATSGLTRTGAVMGSVHYLAPELVRGGPATPRSDIYGLGAVLYEMATGRMPFEGETDLAVALAHVEQTPLPPRSINGRLSVDLERIIERALEKSPDLRFTSAGDLADELQTPPSSPTGAPPARPSADGVTQRMPIVAAPPSPVDGTPRASRQASPSTLPPAPRPRHVVSPTAEAPVRRTARPARRRGAGGSVLALLLAMAAVLVALGAGFFGLATLNRESPSDPGTPTAAPRPSPADAVGTATLRTVVSPLPAATATVAPPSPEPSRSPSPLPSPSPSPSPQPSPSPLPSPSPVPSSPTPLPATPTLRSLAVPQLRGKALDAALAALQASGLTATVRGVPGNVDKDVVVDQSPDIGKTLPPGGTVSIVVGTGSTAIPDVAGLPRDQAIKALQNNSFHVNERPRRDPQIPAGSAIDTRPAAGAVVARYSDVELGISQGR